MISVFMKPIIYNVIEFAGEEGVGGGGGGGGGKQRHNSDKNIREYFSKHPSSSPVRLTGAKSPSPSYPMVSLHMGISTLKIYMHTIF